MLELTAQDVFREDERNELDPVVERNLRILERRFIPNTPQLSNPEEEATSRYVTAGERRVEGENTIVTAINMRYDTRTGKIIGTFDYNDPNISDGDYSVFRTYLITQDESARHSKMRRQWIITPGKYKILLVYPNDWLTPHAITAAVNEQFGTGTRVDPLASEGQRILPERIIPDRVRDYGWSIMGRQEPWGTSQLVDNANGDMSIKNSIEQFNMRYGPSLTDEFFRKAKIPTFTLSGPRKMLEFLSNKLGIRK